MQSRVSKSIITGLTSCKCGPRIGSKKPNEEPVVAKHNANKDNIILVVRGKNDGNFLRTVQ